MATREYSAKKIELAASEALGKSGPHLKAAHEYAEKFSEMGSVPFGIVPSIALVPTYDAGRKSQTDNLADAVQKLTEMAEGMAEIARAYRRVEKANTIKPRNPDEVDVEKPKPNWIIETGGASLIGLEAGLVGLPWGLSRLWGAAALADAAASKMVPTALFGLVAWGTCLPKPQEIGQAMATWSKVAEELEKVQIHENMQTALDDSDWNSDSEARMAFDRWVTDFGTEVEEAKSAAKSTHVTLMVVLFLLMGLNMMLFKFAIASVATLIALTIVAMFPPAKPAAEAAKYLQGTVLSITNVGVVGGITTLLSAFTPTLVSVVISGTARGFGAMEVKKGGKDDTFVDLDIDWDKLDKDMA